MPDREDISDDECEYSMPISDAEIEAGVWLIDTLEAICKRKRPNAHKAAIVRKFLHRQAEHMAELHHRVHELEEELAVISNGWRLSGATDPMATN
jgi:hypothetical protein